MGVAKLKSGRLKSVIARDHKGREIERYAGGIVIPGTPQPPLEPLPPPTLADMADHLGGALVKWAARGFPIAPREERLARLRMCEGGPGQPRCQHWKPAARLGLGKCNHPSCGCTRAKTFLATEKCPIKKW